MATSVISVRPISKPKTKAAKIQVKKVENTNMSDVQVVDPTKAIGKVTKKVEDLNGKMIEVEGSYILPLATTLNEASAMVKDNESDLLFWFNHGRKIQARAQVAATLGMEFETEELEDRDKQFKNALKNMVEEDTPEADKAEARKFLLSLPKFKDLAETYKTFSPDPKNIDFGQVELKRPSGVRGRRKKEETEGSETESE